MDAAWDSNASVTAAVGQDDWSFVLAISVAGYGVLRRVAGIGDGL